jgi:hypothetical protein
MNKENNGIFLLFEGLPKTIIESQVLMHVRRMLKAGIVMDVWTFAVTSEAFEEAKAELSRLNKYYPEIEIRVFKGFRPAIPLSEFMNASLLFWHLVTNNRKPRFIHARTEHATMIAGIIKNLRKFKLIWDSRGHTAAEFIYSINSLSIFKKLFVIFKKIVISRRIKYAFDKSDAAIFVSQALKLVHADAYPNDRCEIVPCLADESIFFFNEVLRKEKREELGIIDDEIVFIYTGSTAYWQCLPEMVEFLNNSLLNNPKVKAIILSSDTTWFIDKFNENLSDRIIFGSVPLHQINAYLNAADFGILLRHPNPINYVASPVKFAEYSLCGLTVMSSNSVDQVMVYGNILDNLQNDKNIFFNTPDNIKRSKIANNAKLLLGSSAYEKKLEKIYKRFI